VFGIDDLMRLGAIGHDDQRVALIIAEKHQAWPS